MTNEIPTVNNQASKKITYFILGGLAIAIASGGLAMNYAKAAHSEKNHYSQYLKKVSFHKHRENIKNFVQKELKANDKNKDGLISYQEFKTTLTSVFKKSDENNSSSLTQQEIKNFYFSTILNNEKKQKKYEKKQKKNPKIIFNFFDTDKSDDISLEEVLALSKNVYSIIDVKGKNAVEIKDFTNLRKKWHGYKKDHKDNKNKDNDDE